jgi:hypothetical protein
MLLLGLSNSSLALNERSGPSLTPYSPGTRREGIYSAVYRSGQRTPSAEIQSASSVIFHENLSVIFDENLSPNSGSRVIVALPCRRTCNVPGDLTGERLADKRHVTLILRLVVDSDGALAYGEVLDMESGSSARFASWQDLERTIQALIAK